MTKSEKINYVVTNLCSYGKPGSLTIDEIEQEMHIVGLDFWTDEVALALIMRGIARIDERMREE